MSLLTPQRWKFRKQRRGRIQGFSTQGTKVSFGTFGMKAMDNAYLSSRQIEAARKVIVRYTRKVGNIWLRVFPDVPYTTHGLEMPMGSGKGDVDHYRVRVRRGKILFEVSGLDKTLAEKVFHQAAHKLPMSIRMVERAEIK